MELTTEQGGAVAVFDNEQVRRLERLVAQVPQVDLRTEHALTGKCYARTIHIPAGTVLTGAAHNRDHICIVIGDITVTTDDGPKRITGYHVFEAKAGMKRAGFAHCDTAWTTVHYTELTDITAIEDELTDESEMLQTRRLALAQRQPNNELEG